MGKKIPFLLLLLLCAFPSGFLILPHKIAARETLPATLKDVDKSVQAQNGWDKIQNEIKKSDGRWVEKRLNWLNRKSTFLMLQQLERLEKLLVKIEGRVGKSDDLKVQTAKIFPRLDEIKLKIQNLKLQLKVQTEKNYAIEAQSETSLRWQAGQVWQTAMTDIKILRDSLIQIKKELNEIVYALQK